MHISPDLMSMDDPDLSTPRQLGAFIIAFDPTAFVSGAARAGMEHYLASLRDSLPRDGARSWRRATANGRGGAAAPQEFLDPATIDAFKHLESTTGIRPQTAPE